MRKCWYVDTSKITQRKQAVATIDWRNQHIEPDGQGDRKRRAN